MSNIKILIVEDDSIGALNIRHALESFGYKVPYIASDGEEAIEKAFKIKPDLILMGIVLEGNTDGIEASSAIKELDIPVIYLTEHSEDVTLQRVLETDPYGYLLKPIDPIELKITTEIALHRKQREKELKADTDHFHFSLMNLLDDIIFVIDIKDHKPLYMSSAVERITGWSKDSFFQNQNKWIQIIHPEDRSSVLSNMLEIETIHEGKRMEYRIFTADGGIKWLSETFKVIYDKKGEPMHVIGQAIDITTRKIYEEELKNSERKYRTIFENTGNLLLTFDKDGTILMFNSEWEKLTGYTKKEVEGKMKWMEFVHPKCREMMNQYQKQCLKAADSATNRCESVFLDSSGNPRNVYFMVTALPGTDNWLASAIDITDLKKTEEAFRESEEFNRSIIASSPDCIKVLDLRGNLLYMSEGGQWLMEVDDVTSILNTNFIDFYDDEFKADALDAISNAVKGGVGHFRGFCPTLKGTLKWWDVFITPILDSKGKPEKLSAISRDITDQVKAEKSLKISEKRFRTVAETATDAIVTTDAEGNMIYFNDSLTKIFGYTEEEVMGKPVSILLPEKFKKMHQNEIFKFKESDGHPMIGQTLSTKGLKKDGTEFPFEMSLSSWRSHEKTFFTAIIRDITTQEMAEEQTQEHLKKLAIINEVLNTANNALNLPNLLKDVFKSIITLLEFESGGIYLLEPDTGYINLEYHENIPEAFLEEVRRMKIEDEPYSTVYIKGKPIYNYTATKTHLGDVSDYRSTAAVPIYSASRVIGSLSVASMKPSITDLEKDILESIGRQIGTIIARMYSESRVKDSLREKEILLKEIHHRVKNNLQIISSLLDLQEVYVKEDSTAVNVLMESQNRVLSMAIIHEMLYQSNDISSIDFGAYINNLVSNLSESYGIDNIKFIIDAEEIYLNMDTSIPLGLLVSELVSNSLKYAFPDKQIGELNISLKQKNGLYELIVEDNGIGFPENIDFKNVQSTLGLQLVNSLVNQLDGTIGLDRNHGTKFTIKFKELKYKERV